MTRSSPLRIGLVGAGIGGLGCSISIAKNGGKDVKVTILEAASELGEIGAGIQMTPNVSRLLIRWGVDKAIGNDLVEVDHLNLRHKDGTKVGYNKMDSRPWSGVPWWVVHRRHLHDGLVKIARENGVHLIVGARISDINHSSSPVTVKSDAGRSWDFDVLIGSDGLNSVVRKSFLPDVKPKPPTGNSAFRAIVPMERVRNDPLTRDLTETSQMDIWMGANLSKNKPHGYIISYPISGGRDFNMVLEHHHPRLVETVEDVTLEEVKWTYQEYDPKIRRVIEMIEHPIKRWPLMATVCPTWSSPQKNMVLMGDAAHSMVNHMAQGAATSMEDGGFLGIVLGLVAKGKMQLADAIDLYEKERRPLADIKQQVSYLNGLIYHLEDGSEGQAARDRALANELTEDHVAKSPNLYLDPWTRRTIYDYDAEVHAHRASFKVLNGKDLRDPTTHVTDEQADIFLNWFLKEEDAVKAKL